MRRPSKIWSRSSNGKTVQKNNGLFLLVIYFALAIYLLPMFPHGGSANELTRWATAASLVEKGSFEIGWTEDLIGKNVDTAKIGDKIYSNKAPGTAVLSVPFYAVTRIFVGAPDASNIRISWFVMRFFIATLPLFLLAYWLYRREADELSLGTLLFATPLFVYSLLFFSHVFVAVVIYFAFRLLFDDRFTMRRQALAAGLLSGLAVISEFPAIFAVVILGIGLFFTDKRERNSRVFFYVLGGLPFAAALLLYNYALFGSPFALSYAYESFPEWAEVAGQGFLGIGFPTLSNFYLLLFSPARGLFFFSPILILSVVAFFRSKERRTLRHRVKIAVIVFSIALLCGHGAAHGGWAFGARYLIFVIPLMLDSFFDSEIYEFSNLWQGFLFGVSFLFCTLPALTFPFAPPEFRFPHNDFWGAFLINEAWATPNLLNVFGAAGSIWTLIPAFILLIAAMYFVCQNARRPVRFALGLLGGVIFVGIYVFLPNLDSRENEFRRATIAERFFKPANRLEQFRNNAVFAPRVDDFELLISVTRSFAPDDFPYLETRELSSSPEQIGKKVLQLQQQGNLTEAENLLVKGKTDYPFARCEFSTNLAVIYYGLNRKEDALRELESVQNLVNPASRPHCLRSQFLLGNLYRENGAQEKAAQTFQKFLANSQKSKDPEIIEQRKQISATK